MIIYHGTSLSFAKRLLRGDFPAPGTLKDSVGYTINATNLLSEARNFAKRKKRHDPHASGAVVEIELSDDLRLHTDIFSSSDNNYRYEVYKHTHPDMIDIGFANGFHLDLLYGFDKVQSCKIVEIL